MAPANPELFYFNTTELSQKFMPLRQHPYWLSILLFVVSCDSNQQTITRSFYFWESEFQLSDHERSAIDELKINKLYIKFFDVTWDHATAQPKPVAGIRFIDPPVSNVKIVPVLFITNETLSKINREEIKTLAFKVSKLLEDLLNQSDLKTPEEIQIDCD